LLKDDEIALIDNNGRYSINFGTYSNLFFAKCDIIRIQKNNKYGYIDRKLKAITSNDFDQATDFENNIAIVSKNGKSILINKEGKPLFTIKVGVIKKIEINLFQVENNELLGLINDKGETLLNIDYTSIEKIKSNLYRCIHKDGSLNLFNVSKKSLTKL
jgi:hypothetical protein